MFTVLTNRFQHPPAHPSISRRSSDLKPSSSNLTAATTKLSDDNSLDNTIPSSNDSITSVDSFLEEGRATRINNDNADGLFLQEPLLLFPEPTKTSTAITTTSWLDFLLDPRVTQGRFSIPLQSQARPWLRYLIVVPLFTVASAFFFGYYWVPMLLVNGAFEYMDRFIMVTMSRWSWWLLIGIPLVWAVASDMSTELATCIFLWRGRCRRELPSHIPRLTHAVIICNYKEPLEVLRATIQSLATNTLAANTMIILACEERDPTANETFQALQEEFSTTANFKAFLQTRHTLAPGEVIGKSSNENYACRELYRILNQEYPELDPFQVMVTTCDADSLFDTVFLEQVEAEYCRMPDGRRFLYNAPINTYRNLGDCHWFVRPFEIRRCQYDTFSVGQFRPTQSNYSLTLGFARELDYWDPSNTSEDFHTTLKAMAMTGKGNAVVVKVWSLILNDSVTDLKDRWIQAKRHMWGIEEIAFCTSLFPVVRMPIWTSMMALVTGQMYSVCFQPAALYFLMMSPVRQAFFSLRTETQYWMLGMIVAYGIYNWIKVILRDIFLYQCILKDRSLLMQRSWNEWIQFVLGYPFMSQLGFLLFATIATWRMLIHAMFHETLVYVTAPKALNVSITDCSSIDAKEEASNDNNGIPSFIHSKNRQAKKGI